MNKFYIGKCSKGLIVFKAIANTPLEQADCAKDIKNLIKKGLVLSWLMQTLQHQPLNGATKPDAKGA